MSVAIFQTEEQVIETQILRNLEASDGKERSYFDVMRGVNMTSDLAVAVKDRLMKEGVLFSKDRTSFLNGQPHKLTYYRGNMRIVSERLSNE